ncbi:hypothetical protein NLX83_35315 [Allokutzneria sp. A3M-2-11 16]|uniref:hypothetical protein n=1 Tax=Allokutzneria sp. A3M-2-11 16 TaxID=2962043 RepID=UPI0020B7EC40|nr:hypothetical protein [Allokutzneria sp. A3M-2-11 16]MCP3804553.1 hypothetical protein [Allokutzneria sp. A3M-2-11 16]
MSAPPQVDRGSVLAEVLGRELAVLRATADRADPVEETVLSLVECAALAAEAVRELRSGVPASRSAELLEEVLATARAAVLTASHAVIESRGGLRS